MLVDSHAHLNFTDYADKIDEIIAVAQAAGVEKIVNIGTSLQDSREAIDLALKYEGLYATIGVHPNDNPTATVENVDWQKFEDLAKEPKVVAIGETGLDYSRFRNLTVEQCHNEKRRQKQLFIQQVEIAAKLNLPLSIHIRDAQDDLMNLFSTSIIRIIEVPKLKGVFHCFSGDQKYLEFILTKLPNFYISFAGNLTFPAKGRSASGGKNAHLPLPDLAKLVPFERLLVETDCPFLAPEPHRGSQNEPANVKLVAAKLAEVKNISFEEIEKITSLNAMKLFNLNQKANAPISNVQYPMTKAQYPKD